MSIRPFTMEEIPLLGAIGEEFVAELHTWRETLDNEHFINNWRALYKVDKGTLIGWWENGKLVGFIGGVVFEDFYDKKVAVADLGWFVSKAFRGKPSSIKLLLAFEKWAKDRGAIRMTFAKVVWPGDTTLTSFRRLGYEPREISYGKFL